MKLTYLSRFAVKFIEVAGPGLASALCAYFLGQIERSPAPAPATAVVQISPATIENAAREAGVAVAAQNAADTQPERVSIAPAMPSAPKPAKSASTAPARRKEKSEQGVASARSRRRAPASHSQSTQPPFPPPPRQRRRGKVSRLRRAAMSLQPGAARKSVRSLPSSSPRGSCRKTTEFSAICRGRPCRSANHCVAPCN